MTSFRSQQALTKLPSHKRLIQEKRHKPIRWEAKRRVPRAEAS